ncbi:MFS transporter [Paenibacillus sp. ACRRX]|uniref:MFS transporter n=1 Tax=Paenibacillus sp. ACRRX TaxID=2918206 RepID=UPI001EF4F136|nr:MFS transporter [Paenibacillus sp. ACRRX]MCG7408816.1 MFS transporter [Paenibacillus sp. ACRRX]
MYTYKGDNRLILGICLAVSTFWLFTMSMMVVTPVMNQTLALPMATLNMAVSMAALIAGVSIVVAGGIADKIGRVKMTKIGIILSIVGCVCCALTTTDTSSLLMFGRVLQGLSAAFIMPSSLALINEYYEGAERQRALSFWSISSWGGGGIASFFGGAVASLLGWQWIFWLSIPVAIAAIFLIQGTPESKVAVSDGKQRVDYVGLVIFIAGLLMLNLFITRGAEWGWTSLLTLGMAAGFVILFILFLLVEKRVSQPLIDLSLFKNSAYNGAAISNFMLNFCAVGAIFVMSSFVQESKGISSFHAGLLTMGYLVTTLIMIRVGELILKKKGPRPPMALGCFLTTIGIALPMLTFLPDVLYLVLTVVGFAIMGLGLGVSATPSTDTAVSGAPKDKVGVASGLYKMASSLGGSFGTAVSGAIYSAILLADPSAYTQAGFWGIFANVLIAFLALIIVLICVPQQAARAS